MDLINIYFFFTEQPTALLLAKETDKWLALYIQISMARCLFMKLLTAVQLYKLLKENYWKYKILLIVV